MTSKAHGRAIRCGVVAAALVLTACGGSVDIPTSIGGSASAPPPVTIPEGVRVVVPSAAADLREEFLDAQLPPLVRALLIGSSGALLDPIGGSAPAPQGVGRRGAAGLPVAAAGTALAWLRRLPDPHRRHALAAQEETVPCAVSGSLRVAFDDVDQNRRLGAGDTITFTAQACVDDPALPSIDGGFSMQVDAVQLDAAGDPEGLAVTGRFLDFAVTGFGVMSGDFRLWVLPVSATRTRLRISYLGATVVDLQGTTVYDFDVDGEADATQGSLVIGGGLGLAGQTYAVQSASAIGYSTAGLPGGGVLELSDAAGDRLRLLPRDDGLFDAEFWPAGATQPAWTRTGLAWADYAG